MHLCEVEGDRQQPVKVRFDKRKTVPGSRKEKGRGKPVPLVAHAHICVIIAAVEIRPILQHLTVL